MLLTSIMVTSVFSVALTVKTGGSKGENKLKATAGARYVASILKDYVTGEPGNASTVLPMIPGPSTSLGNNWSITNPTTGVVDACPLGGSACYALTPGNHILTGVLPAAFEAAPYNARVSYVVTYTNIIDARPVPKVDITVTWTDP